MARAVGAALALCISLGVAGPATATDVRQHFAATWRAREKSYVAAQQNAAEAEKAKVAIFMRTARSNATGDAVAASFQGALSETRRLAFEQSRLKVLRELEALMATKPSGPAARAWLQHKSESLEAMLPTPAFQEDQLRKVSLGVDEPVGQWMNDKGGSAAVGGMVAGLASELVLIDRDLRSLYAGLSERGATAGKESARITSALAASDKAMHALRAYPLKPFRLICPPTGKPAGCRLR